MVSLTALTRSLALPHALVSSFSLASHSRGHTVARAASGTTASSTGLSKLEVAMVPCLKDNYGFLLHDAATGATAAVDTPEAEPLKAELASRGWQLTHIFNT